MLVGGMDVSGKPGKGNYHYMAFVIGTVESLATLAKILGFGDHYIHMSDSRDKRKQKDIRSKLKFDNINIVSFCIKICKDEIVKELSNSKLMQNNQFAKSKISSTYDYILCDEVKKIMRDFLLKHNCTFKDVVYQCDADCISIAKAGGLQYEYGGMAHMLADVVAWFNNHGEEPSGAIPIDLTDVIRERLWQSFGLKYPRTRSSMR